jgi:hypothetical protein
VLLDLSSAPKGAVEGVVEHSRMVLSFHSLKQHTMLGRVIGIHDNPGVPRFPPLVRIAGAVNRNPDGMGICYFRKYRLSGFRPRILVHLRAYAVE